MALGAGTVQVCTAAMAYGFKIVQEMVSGLERCMDEKGYPRVADFVGRAVPNVTDWQYLNLNYVAKARIDQDLCIKCGRCHIVCEDTSHQAITHDGRRRAPLRGDGRRMRRLQSLRQRLPGRGLHHHGAAAAGEIDARTGTPVEPVYANWTHAPEQPDGGAKTSPAGRAGKIARRGGAMRCSGRPVRCPRRQRAVEEDRGEHPPRRIVEFPVGEALAGDGADLTSKSA